METFSEQAGSRRLPNDSSVLDFLRASAVLMVLAAHMLQLSLDNAPIQGWDFRRLGLLGVLLFFVHTSLVLMRSLARTNLQGRALAASFYIRRAFRIYPLAVVTVIGVWWSGMPPVPGTPHVDVTPGILTTNLLLMQNLWNHPDVLGPLWSLPLEIQMYLVLPFLFRIVDGGRGARPAAAVLMLLLAVALGTVADSGLEVFAPCFLSGVLGYCLAGRWQARWPFWVFAAALWALSLGFITIASALGSGRFKPLMWTACLLAGLLIPLCRETKNTRVAQVSKWIARYSYGIYLAHIPVLWLVAYQLQGIPAALQLTLLVILLVAVPVVAYHGIEAPLIRVGTRIAARATESKRGQTALAEHRQQSPEPGVP